ncbi:MAG TPA: hypothetical protein VNY05_00200 [Candidatus Acidoferrales bacterium]|jgi:hypothetical protein|nr:hypothetical protein [Candidatus Acidoferrales bacterium]
MSELCIRARVTSLLGRTRSSVLRFFQSTPYKFTVLRYDPVIVLNLAVQNIKSSETGLLDVGALEKMVDQDVAALMVTNPNTLGARKPVLRWKG